MIRVWNYRNYMFQFPARICWELPFTAFGREPIGSSSFHRVLGNLVKEIYSAKGSEYKTRRLEVWEQKRKIVFPWMLRRVALVRTDVSEELSASILHTHRLENLKSYRTEVVCGCKRKLFWFQSSVTKNAVFSDVTLWQESSSQKHR
jgi:hypothetical protein